MTRIVAFTLLLYRIAPRVYGRVAYTLATRLLCGSTGDVSDDIRNEPKFVGPIRYRKVGGAVSAKHVSFSLFRKMHRLVDWTVDALIGFL